jgi:hypothetical protein
MSSRTAITARLPIAQPAGHTPGPWHYEPDLSLHDTRLIYGSDGRLVADAGRIHKRTEAEMDANARLIGAAPGMLEALKRIVQSAPRTGLPLALEKDIQDACNLITRATKG